MRGGGCDRLKTSFKAGDCVLLKQKTKHTFDVPRRPDILGVVEVRDSGVVVLEGTDAAGIEEHINNIAHNPPPVLDHNLYPKRFYPGATMHCHICGRRSGPRYTVLCDDCNQGYHLWCLEPQLEKMHKDGWKFPKHSGTYLTMATPFKVENPKL